jgi:hypothetical protein
MIVLDCQLTDWTNVEPFDLEVAGLDESKIYGRVFDGTYYSVIKLSMVATGSNSTMWLNTDQSEAPGYRVGIGILERTTRSRSRSMSWEASEHRSILLRRIAEGQPDLDAAYLPGAYLQAPINLTDQPLRDREVRSKCSAPGSAGLFLDEPPPSLRRTKSVARYGA